MEAKGDWRGVLRELTAAEGRAAANLAATLAAAGTSEIAPRPEPMTVYMYTASITAMSKCKRWREALAVLDRMLAAGAAADDGRGEGLTPNLNTMSAVITACGRCGRGKEALEVRRKVFCVCVFFVLEARKFAPKKRDEVSHPGPTEEDAFFLQGSRLHLPSIYIQSR